MRAMRGPSRLVLSLLLLLPQAAFAMRFSYYPMGGAGGAGILAASGQVTLGDAERFQAALHKLPPGARATALSLDSPGGDLEEGLRMGDSVRAARLPTVVGDGAKCASACVIIFAAGSHLFASNSALIGVHSASNNGVDTPDAQAATVVMARRLAEYGVPEAILGKMVTAHPSQIWWLNRSDLDSMRVDNHVPRTDAAAVELGLPQTDGAPAATQAVKPGFKVEAAPHGYHVEPPAHGFHVWQPGR